MMNETLSTIKFEEDSSFVSNDDKSNISEDNFEEKLAELENRVLRLIEFVISDISTLKKFNRKERAVCDKENIDVDKWKRRIYVGNVQTSTSIELLSLHFSQYGKVKDAYFFRTFATCKNAFIEFEDCYSVQKAVNANNFLDGRKLTVGKARRRNDENAKEPLGFKAKHNEFKVLRYRPY